MKTKSSLFLVASAIFMVVGIFVVNAYTAPLIEEARLQREYSLYFDIVPDANGLASYTPLSNPPVFVRSMTSMTQDENDYVLVYESTIKGWNDGIELLLFVYVDRLEIAGIRIVAHNETVGIGDRLLENPSFLSQFNELNGSQLINQGLDQIAGTSAPITQLAIEEAIIEILQYHQAVVLNEVAVDTTLPIIRILALATTFNAGTTEPNWEDYFVVTNKDSVTVTINRGSLNMNVASASPYEVKATAVDQNGNQAQASIFVTIVAEEDIIEIINVEPNEERSALFNEWFPNNTKLSDVTQTVVLIESVTNVYQIFQVEDVVATVYEASAVGFYRNTPIQLLLVIQPSGAIDRLVILSSNENEGYGQLLNNADYLQGFRGLDFTAVEGYDFDSVAETTRTRTGLKESILLVLAFHQTLENSK
jgi:Na+-translocating ferredoxin:NAD+ oxidoreductase RnfG subunit